VRTGEELHKVKEERINLHTIKRRKANWISHILQRNCLLKHIFEENIEGEIEVTETRERRSKQLLDGLKERREYRKLIDEALNRTV
jgi:hypothetical protein